MPDHISFEEFNSLNSATNAPATDLGTVHLDPANVAPTPVYDSVPHDQIAFTPYDDPSVVKNALRLGMGEDNKPIVNVQAVPDGLRLAAVLAFDDINERRNFLQKKLGPDWIVARGPSTDYPSNFAIKRKGTSHWGVLDPAGLNPEELLKEGQENVDLIAQATLIPAGFIAGALTTGGIETARQALKKYVDPETSLDITSIGLNTAMGGVAGGVSAKMLKTGAAVKEGLENAVDSAKGGVSAAEKSGLLGKVLGFTEKPMYVAQEIGATKRNINEIADNIDYLFTNHPQAKDALRKLTFKGKLQAVNDLVESTGKQLSEIYGNPNAVVKTVDILDTPEMQMLDDVIQTGKLKQGKSSIVVDQSVRKQAAQVKRSFLEQLGTMILEQDKPSPYMNAFRAGKGKLAKLPMFKAMGVKTDEDALMALIGQEEHPIADLWALKRGLAQKLKWGKGQGEIPAVSTARKYVLDSIDNLTTEAVRTAGGDDLAALNKLYNNLVPVRDVLDSTVRGKAVQAFNPLKEIPGALNGFKRGAVMLARNLLNRTEVRSILRGGAGIEKDLPETAAALKNKLSPKLFQQMIRGGGFLEEKNLAQHNLLPRQVDTYFADPDMLNQLTQTIGQSDLTDGLVRMAEKGDKEGAANVLSQLAAGNPELFDPAPYNSAVTQDDMIVINDKYDREQYRQYLAKSLEDPKERYKAMQALNKNNQLTKKPFEAPIAPTGNDITKTPQGSTVSRVAATLKEANLVDIGDGQERRDYDY